jgi:phycocyanobilin:ferredoxin oxidoreductase
MSYKQKLDSFADDAIALFVRADATPIPTEDYGWKNYRFTSDTIRVAHIERYSDGKLDVLHITCFPVTDHYAPIFGFDIIATEKKCLAAFLDWSPTVCTDPIMAGHTYHTYDTPYKLPDWATLIFSSYATAIVPSESEFDTICDEALNSLSVYVDKYCGYKDLLDNKDTMYNKDLQNYYCTQQLKNERTYSVLKAKLGEDRAKHFMEAILFPKA